MEAIPLCSLRNELHLLTRKKTQVYFVQIVPLRVRYMFRPVLRPLSGISIQKIL